MAMRALLRGAASKSWRSRSIAAECCSPISRECQSDVASAAIAFSSSSSRAFSSGSQTLKTPGYSSRPGLSSHSVSKLLRCLSPSSSFASVPLQNASPVSSIFISVPSSAPLSSLSAGLHRSRTDLRLGELYGGAQQVAAGSSALCAMMQQRRGLSKLKKYKIKSYSSYKERFRLMADGTYKRWRSGTRHNAHSKTPKQRRQLRRPSVAPAALATVMKKLHFVR